ncbi:MAG: hypothetical protein AB1394_11830, partial [Bacteroidota bacterium]
MYKLSLFVKARTYVKFGIFVLFFFGFFNNHFATEKNVIISKLIEHGFENIRIKLADSRILIAYENRVYRFEVEALNEILKIVVPLINDREELVLIPLNRKIPIVKFSSALKNCRDFLDKKIDAKKFI